MTRQELDKILQMIEKGKLFDGINVGEKPSAEKIGYILTPVVIDPTHIVWEYIKDESYAPEGTGDYLSPIHWVEGMPVETNKFYYYDDYDVRRDAIKDGIPSSFDDTEYFFVV